MKVLTALCLLPELALAQFTSGLTKVTVNVGAGASAVSSLTSCATPSRGTFELLTTDSLTYVCDGADWRHVYTDADGTLPDVATVVPGLTFVAHATTGNHAVEVTTGARVCLDGNTCSVHISYDGTNAKVTGAPLRAAGGYTTVVANAASGQHAIELNTGARACLNGSACSVYAQYDGGTVGIVGAELEVPLGFSDSQKVNPDTIITPLSVVAQAPSGQAAFKVAHTGARVYFDVGGNLYCASDGAQVVCGSAWMIQTVSVDTIGSFTANRVVDIFNPHIYPVSSLGTCNGNTGGGNIPEGTVKVQTGASLSAQSRVCACVSDGAGTPAWTWINLGCPNTAGTDTTCPACP